MSWSQGFLDWSMTCRELTSFIGDHLAGELDLEVRTAFDRHLSVCPNCRQYLADYQRTTQLSRSIVDHSGEPVPADVPEALVSAILAARQTKA
jgi:anti-sigma factor RsiW